MRLTHSLQEFAAQVEENPVGVGARDAAVGADSGWIRAGVQTVVERLDLPLVGDLLSERFATEIEASVYFIVAEALATVVKHAQAAAKVRAHATDGVLHVEAFDNGVGGAGPGGHWLMGMNDRVMALGGRVQIKSPRGGGTRLEAMLPLRN